MRFCVVGPCWACETRRPFHRGSAPGPVGVFDLGRPSAISKPPAQATSDQFARRRAIDHRLTVRAGRPRTAEFFAERARRWSMLSRSTCIAQSALSTHKTARLSAQVGHALRPRSSAAAYSSLSAPWRCKQNLKADPRRQFAGHANSRRRRRRPAGSGKSDSGGKCSAGPGHGPAAARESYLARQANSKYWVDFEDFAFYRMDVVDVYYVGGFGVMGWVTASEYLASQPDPLADSMAGIIQHMNAITGIRSCCLAGKFAGI